MRQAGAVAVGAAAAALGALILGEYELGPLAGLVAGVVLGFVVAEVAALVRGDADQPAGRAVTVALAAVAGAALVWAGWIDVRNRDESIGAGAWLGALAAVVTVAVRTGRGSGRTAGSSSSPDPPRTR